MAGKRGNPAWQKGGPSPNPGGRSAAATELRQALECMAEDAGKRLKELIGSEDERIALEASKFVVDHVKGKPSQSITGPDDGPVKVDASSGIYEMLKRLDSERK